MKNKLELYLAVQAAAEATLTERADSAQTALEELVKPLAPADRDFAVQLFWSRRQRMTALAGEALGQPVSAPAKLKG